jgi:sulfate adenylyltransferase subunit 1 (EFTu-like GTPase family)
MMEQLSGKFFSDSMKQAAKKITVEIKDVKRQGDKATVTYNTSSGLAENSIHLVKVDGDWKVQWTKQDQMGASDSNAIVPAPQVARRAHPMGGNASKGYNFM